jgi:aspartyl-tRNA synthetase
MHQYRTHTCGQLAIEDVDKVVKLSGWVHRKRNHGQILFIDLRDNFGITQLVFNQEHHLLARAAEVKLESVLTVTGKVVNRGPGTTNSELATGEIEVIVETLQIESPSDPLPLSVNSDQDSGEDVRLKYRYLDLRRERIHRNILRRSEVIACIRQKMQDMGFTEFQTPILTSGSPEGARDFLVPSRLHPGKFYALPQAPQIFKQLAMIAGFDKYFQIAPCFRDEDSRADRSPGEFYQLDLEMSFVTQDDVFAAVEPVVYEIFKKFSTKHVSSMPFRRIRHADSMLNYGSDKPDLRNPILIRDVTQIFVGSEFTIFASAVKEGAVVRAIPAPGTASEPRSFFDKMISFAIEHGASGLAYIIFTSEGAKGPIVKFLNQQQLTELKLRCGLVEGDSIFFSCAGIDQASKLAGVIRAQLGLELNLINKNKFEICWVTDFPFFELNDQTNKLDFCHNPFSMPQGGLQALEAARTVEDYLQITAYQYDIVCNGIELSSGAIRNHKLDVLYKAFEIVGYTRAQVETQFASIVNALKFGAPPHGGCAPGIDRMLMLLADEPNIREVIMFPMNQKGEDLMMNAPCIVDKRQLQELGIATLVKREVVAR